MFNNGKSFKKICIMENKKISKLRGRHAGEIKYLSFRSFAIRILVLFFQALILFCANDLKAAAIGNMNGKSTFSAGVAKVNITPSVPLVMAGYGARTEPFRGINDSIFAAATVFDNGIKRAVIITAEVLFFCHRSWEELTGRIEKETGIEREYIILAPVHNHGAPSTRIYGDNIDENLLAYNMDLRDKLVRAASEAARNMRPARIGSGSGICKMSMNRRALNANGGIRLGRNPYGPCDQEVGVVRLDDREGIPFSIFINWPTHATVMGGGNYFISGDWPGAARRYIERESPWPVTATVTAGASGDIDPIYRVRPDFRESETEEIGIILGREAIRVAEEITSWPAASINAMQRVISLPGKIPGGSNQPEEVFEAGPDLEVRLSLLRVGNILFAGISGEVFTEIGMKIKELSPYRHTWVITHCNGASGYLITDEAYGNGGYEVSITRAMPGAEAAIIHNMVEMMNLID